MVVVGRGVYIGTVYKHFKGNLYSEVDHKKYPDVKQKYRFEEVASMLWCEHQCKDSKGIFCDAHIAEGRAFSCPYNSPEHRLEADHPCSDYESSAEAIIDKLASVGCVYPVTSKEIAAAIKRGV